MLAYSSISECLLYIGESSHLSLIQAAKILCRFLISLLTLLVAILFLFICAQSLCRIRHFATPWIITLFQAPLPMKFFRQEYWSGLPFPPLGDLPDPGVEPTSCISCIGRQVLYHCTTWEALIFTSLCILAALGLCWAMRAFSSCGTLAVYLQHAGLVASWHVGS